MPGVACIPCERRLPEDSDHHERVERIIENLSGCLHERTGARLGQCYGVFGRGSDVEP